MTKRNDKWTPSNIDWTRLTLVMVIERDFEWDEERGKEVVVPYDYLIDENLPADFPAWATKGGE